MTNPVRNIRLRSALVAFRGKHVPMWGIDNVQTFLQKYGFELPDEDAEVFWKWFCNDRVRPLSNYTEEEVLWGLEKFIDEFSPLDDDKFEQS